jgi:hypothetical protein
MYEKKRSPKKSGRKGSKGRKGSRRVKSVRSRKSRGSEFGNIFKNALSRIKLPKIKLPSTATNAVGYVAPATATMGIGYVGPETAIRTGNGYIAPPIDPNQIIFKSFGNVPARGDATLNVLGRNISVAEMRTMNNNPSWNPSDGTVLTIPSQPSAFGRSRRSRFGATVVNDKEPAVGTDAWDAKYPQAGPNAYLKAQQLNKMVKSSAQAAQEAKDKFDRRFSNTMNDFARSYKNANAALNYDKMNPKDPRYTVDKKGMEVRMIQVAAPTSQNPKGTFMNQWVPKKIPVPPPVSSPGFTNVMGLMVPNAQIDAIRNVSGIGSAPMASPVSSVFSSPVSSASDALASSASEALASSFGKKRRYRRRSRFGDGGNPSLNKIVGGMLY